MRGASRNGGRVFISGRIARDFDKKRGAGKHVTFRTAASPPDGRPRRSQKLWKPSGNIAGATLDSNTVEAALGMLVRTSAEEEVRSCFPASPNLSLPIQGIPPPRTYFALFLGHA